MLRSKLVKVCGAEGCLKKIRARGYCKYHYEKFLRARLIPRTRIFAKNEGCMVLGCEKLHLAMGYCTNHYHVWRRNGDPLKVAFIIDPNRGCKVEGCDRKHCSKGYCCRHYQRLSNPRTGNYRDNSIEEVLAMNNAKRRDNHTCQWWGCGRRAKDGFRIEAHHIFPKSEYPELSYIERYIISYCRNHHGYWHKMRGDNVALFGMLVVP